MLGLRKIAQSKIVAALKISDGTQHITMVFSEALGNLHAASGASQ
jgi:hypothetical protein